MRFFHLCTRNQRFKCDNKYNNACQATRNAPSRNLSVCELWLPNQEHDWIPNNARLTIFHGMSPPWTRPYNVRQSRKKHNLLANNGG